MSAVKARPNVQAPRTPRQKPSDQVSSNVDRSIDRRPRNNSRAQQRRRQRERTREQQFRIQSINYDVQIPQENKERPRRIRKVYRRKKVLRKWVFPALFFVPLGMIWVEYYIGKLIDLEDIRDVYQDQLVDPWDLLQQDFNASRIRERGSISSLPKLAYAPQMQCPPGQRRMINVHNPVSGSQRRIPMIVHQQSKTRCLTMKIDAATTKWAMKRWSYYMHDEDSRNRLFEEYCGGGIPTCEFPLLSQIVGKCFYNQTDTQNRHRYYSLKTELWKFLTLWIFGGVYADIDFQPYKFSPITITPSDDAFLVIDSDTNMLSTKLMAVSPRHPIMYYAVQQMLLSILMEDSPSSLVSTTGNENGISGSSVLSAAFRMFQEEEGDKVHGESTKFSPGTFHGAMSRTARLVASGGLNTKAQTDGDGEKGYDLVVSIFQSETAKEVEFQKMGMTAEESKELGGDDTRSNSIGEILEEGGATPRLSCRQKLYHF